MSQGFDPSLLIDGSPDTAGQPLYIRIRQGMMRQIASGAVPAGSRLPTIRSLAQAIDVNPMTVAKAYKAIIEDGYAEAQGSRGTFARLPAIGSRESDIPAPIGPAVLSQQLYSLARAPGVIGFTTNYPDPAIADVAAFRNCLAEVAADETNRWFRYDPATGRDELRTMLPSFLARRGIAARMQDVIVTAGAQQALDLVVRTLVAPGDPVIVERPSYFGGLNVLRAARARLLEVPLQSDGPDVDKLEDLVRRHRPRLMYLNPTFHNPTGITTSHAKRQHILAISQRHDVAILEDDHCPELRFTGEAVPSYKALAADGDAVYYAAGFGKTVVPGVRLGLMLPPAGAAAPVVALKAVTDLQSTAVMQGALALYLSRGSHVGHAAAMAAIYYQRQKILVAALRAHLPETMRIDVPDGGLSLWLTLPATADVTKIYFLAAQRGVAFAPGQAFFATEPDLRTLRLSFGLTPEHELVEGSRRLATVIRDLVEPSQRPAVAS